MQERLKHGLTNTSQAAQKLEESGMKAISYALLLCLYLMAQGWSFLELHFLLPIGIVLTMVAIGMVFIVTAEDRKKLEQIGFSKDV